MNALLRSDDMTNNISQFEKMAYGLNIESDEDCTAFYEHQQRLIDEHIKKPIEELLESGLLTDFNDQDYEDYLNG